MSAAINPHDVIAQFKDFGLSIGITLPENLNTDTTDIQTFKIDGKDKGRYKLHTDGIPAGFIQDWSGESHKWKYDDPDYKPPVLTTEQRNQQAKDKQAKNARIAKETADKNAAAAEKAAVIWKLSSQLDSNKNHEYLVKKGITGIYSARINEYKGITSLVIPLGKDGKISTLQFINPDGSKKLLTGGQKSGCYSILNKMPNPKVIAIAEGYATIASILDNPYSQKIGYMGVMAIDAGNLEQVAVTMCNKYPQAAIILFGDKGDKDHKGEKSARAAAVACGGYCVLPPIEKGDFNDYLTGGAVTASLKELVSAACGNHDELNNDSDYRALNHDELIGGYNDFQDTEQPSATTQQSATERNKTQQNDLLRWSSGDDLADNAKAPDYLINDILEADSHGILLGASMTFKSFLALELAHCICTGGAFFGHEVFTTGKVLYICGEGRGALERRIKALKIVKGGFNNNLMVLDTPINIDGSVNMASLSDLINEYTPHLVIFDTFGSLNGGTNENDNSEVGKVLNLVKETCRNGKTSSLIVHHLGKDESRGARGAGSFKNNVDFYFDMKRTTDTMTAILSCVKMKDGDNFADIYMDAHVVELGLIRQDGKLTTSLVLKVSDSIPIEKNSGKPLDVVSKNVLTALNEAIEKNGVEPPKEIKAKFSDSPQNCPAKVVHIDHLRPFAYPYLNVADNSKRVALKRCIEKLELHSKAMFFNGYLWIAY